MHLEGFQVGSSHLWALVCTGLTGQSAGPVQMLHTSLTCGVDRSDRSGLSCCRCHVSSCVLDAFIQAELHWFRGACMCAGELFVVFKLWFCGLHSLLEHSFVSDVSSSCPCLRHPRLAFFK
jgi:hypothetical protein